LGATTIIVAVVFNLSRTLLVLEKRNSSAVSTALAILVAAAVLFGSAYFSSRLEAHTARLAVLGSAAIVLVFAGGYGLGATQAEKGEAGGQRRGGGVAAGFSTEVRAMEFAFDPNDISAPRGLVKITLKNDGNNLHTFLFDNVAQFRKLEAEPKETATGAVDLRPGTYTFYCAQTGHRGAGMEGKLKVG
jgi:plastocyanin